MKNLFAKTFSALFILGLLTFSVSPTRGADLIEPKTEAAMSAEAEVLITRLKEIESMDKKALTRLEKKELRREVKSIKAQLADLGGGVYISVGAIIIILLLVIILL